MSLNFTCLHDMSLTISRLHTKRTSPLTNMQLARLDLRSDAQAKQKLDAYLQGTDVHTAQSNAQTILISIKSPLGSWTKDLPNTLTLRDLYALAFRLMKSRYVKFEMRHKNAVLPWSSAHSVGNDVTPGIDIFITPVEKVGESPTNAVTGAMCLVKVYSIGITRPPSAHTGSQRIPRRHCVPWCSATTGTSSRSMHTLRSMPRSLFGTISTALATITIEAL